MIYNIRFQEVVKSLQKMDLVILIVCFHAQRNGQVPFPIECSRAYSSWESRITTLTLKIIDSDVAMTTV